MPVMVTCQNCGFPFPSTVLQIAETNFRLGTWRDPDGIKKYSESCPKCRKRFEYYEDNFFWKDLGEA
jgi:predicted nucleic-acid-binding Zn-ribbon protein